LAVGETGDFGSVEGTIDEGLDAGIVDFLVGGVLIKGIIKIERGFFNIFCKINFLSEFNEMYFI
jgi:hypothetical protein